MSRARKSSRKRSLLDQYIRIKILGEGGSGVAYLSAHRETRKLVVNKVIFGKDDYAAQMFDHERAILEKIKPNCKKYLNCIIGHEVDAEGNLNLFVEYIDNSILLKDAFFENVTDFLHMVHLTFDGLRSLHRMGVYHLDIHPQNVMFDPLMNRIHYIDYGLACEKNDIDCLEQFFALIESSDNIMFPLREYLERPDGFDISKLAQSYDVWRLGVSLLYVLTGTTLTSELIPLMGYQDAWAKASQEGGQGSVIREIRVNLTDELVGQAVKNALRKTMVDLSGSYNHLYSNREVVHILFRKHLLRVNYKERASTKDLRKMLKVEPNNEHFMYNNVDIRKTPSNNGYSKEDLKRIAREIGVRSTGRKRVDLVRAISEELRRRLG